MVPVTCASNNPLGMLHSYPPASSQPTEGAVQQTGKDRSLRRSFKLSVLPAEAQEKTASSKTAAIPIPKILERSWKKIEIPMQEKLPPVSSVPVKDSDPNKMKYSEGEDISPSSSSECSPFPQDKKMFEPVHGSAFAHMERDPGIQRTRSLDDLLAANKSVTIILDSTKPSKYSKLTITASVNMLNEEPQVDMQSNTSCVVGNSKLLL